MIIGEIKYEFSAAEFTSSNAEDRAVCEWWIWIEMEGSGRGLL